MVGVEWEKAARFWAGFQWIWRAVSGFGGTALGAWPWADAADEGSGQAGLNGKEGNRAGARAECQGLKTGGTPAAAVGYIRILAAPIAKRVRVGGTYLYRDRQRARCG